MAYNKLFFAFPLLMCSWEKVHTTSSFSNYKKIKKTTYNNNSDLQRLSTEWVELVGSATRVINKKVDNDEMFPVFEYNKDADRILSEELKQYINKNHNMLNDLILIMDTPLFNLGLSREFCKIKKGESYIHFATTRCLKKCITLIIKVGVNINKQNKDGETPLHLAIESRNPGIVNSIIERLIEQKEDINKQNKDGETPLHLAIKSRDSKIVNSIVERLIEQKEDINKQNKDGETPLILSIIHGHIEAAIKITKLLINTCSDLNIKNLKNYKSIDFAITFKHIEVVQLLTESNADLTNTKFSRIIKFLPSGTTIRRKQVKQLNLTKDSKEEFKRNGVVIFEEKQEELSRSHVVMSLWQKKNQLSTSYEIEIMILCYLADKKFLKDLAL